MALSADRKIDFNVDDRIATWSYPVATGFRLFRNSITAICQDGTLVPAAAANPPTPIVKVLGLARHGQDNTGTTGVVSDTAPATVNVRRGSAALPFDVAPTYANLGAPVYAVDDQTVSLSSNSGARLQLGTLEGFDVANGGTPYVNF